MKRRITIINIFTTLSCFGLLSQIEPSYVKKPFDTILKSDSIVATQPADKRILYNGVDGPYIINDTLYRVNSDSNLMRETNWSNDQICVQVDNEYQDEFSAPLSSQYKISKSSYPLPGSVGVISDIEGNFNAFTSFLIRNHIIDKNHNWIFNNGHLVLVGDFVDRGKNVTPVLWLIYKLEHQAQLNKGQVHFILGNHEVLNFHGDSRYNRGKYIKVAQEISSHKDKTKALKFLYSENSELGKWLRTKNVIERIGSYLFVHAGLSVETLAYELSLEDINIKARLGYNNGIKIENDTTAFIYSGKGPFWYRGMVMDRPNYDKIKNTELTEVLEYYHAQKIVVGHTPVSKISTDYQGKVIRLDISHGLKKYSGKTKGLLIQNGVEYIIDDLGHKTILE